MPAQDRVGRHDGRDLFQQLTTEYFSLHRQPPPLVIIQENALFTELLPQDLILGAEVFNRRLLPPIDPASQNDQQQLPGMQNKTHCAEPWCLSLREWETIAEAHSQQDCGGVSLPNEPRAHSKRAGVDQPAQSDLGLSQLSGRHGGLRLQRRTSRR